MVEAVAIEAKPIPIVNTVNLLEVFHRINKVLPEEQALLYIQHDTTVGEALELLEKNNISQIPVLAGNEVLGIFSYRSFSKESKAYIKDKLVDIEKLFVQDFIEEADFVHILGDFASTIGSLDADDAVLVGQIDNLIGIVTPIDLVKYLYRISAPFIFLGEIEYSIRKVITVCIDINDLPEIIKNTLTENYKGRDLPTQLEEMTFNDYVELIAGKEWKHFEQVFGPGDLTKRRVRNNLQRIRDLRNDVFHFKRELTKEDVGEIINIRSWLKKKIISYQKKMEVKHDEQ